MSTITELIARLRSFAKLGEAMEQAIGQKRGDLTKILFEAADTIEALRLKLSAYLLERKNLYGDWIPCSERLPEKYIGDWLCTTSDGSVMVLPYDTPGDGTKECVFYQWDDDGYFYQTFDVVAWMPLPEPYKGKQARKGKTMDDLISRKAAMKLIESESRMWGDEYGVIDVLHDLEDFPSAEPQRMKGKWITTSDGYVDVVKCGQCGKMTDDISNYCPNCGAEMENGKRKA